MGVTRGVVGGGDKTEGGAEPSALLRLAGCSEGRGGGLQDTVLPPMIHSVFIYNGCSQQTGQQWNEHYRTDNYLAIHTSSPTPPLTN